MATGHELIAAAGARGHGLTEAEAYRLMTDYGIPVPRFGVARDPSEAVRLAATIGYPVVLKISSVDILHKSDVGGVRVGLATEEAVKQAYEEIIAAVREKYPQARIDGILVAEQVGNGDKASGTVEVIIGAVRDPQFGPAIMFGLGGVFVEVLRDVSFRVVPINREDALGMLGEIKGAQILRGIRGQAPRDLEALAGIVTNLSRLLEENPEINAVDLNPVLALAKGAFVVDAKAVI